MEVRFLSLSQVDRNAWNDHINHTSGNFSQFVEFTAGQVGNVSPLFAEVTDGDAVVARWLMFYVGMPYWGYLNIISEPTVQSSDVLGFVLTQAIKRMKPYQLVFHSVVLSKFSNKPFLESFGFQTIYPSESVVIDLTMSEAAIFDGFHRKCKNMVRRAARDSITVYENNSDNGLETFRQLSKETYARSGRKSPFAEVERLHRATSPFGSCRLFFAESNGEPQAVAALLASKRLAIYWHGASADTHTVGVANLLQWEIMRQLRRDGILLYDLGGVLPDAQADSKAQTISKFKTRFGGEFRQYWGGHMIIDQRRARFSKLLKRLIRR